MKEVFYYFVHFESEANVPAEVEQRIRHHGQRAQIFMRKTGSIEKRGIYE